MNSVFFCAGHDAVVGSHNVKLMKNWCRAKGGLARGQGECAVYGDPQMTVFFCVGLRVMYAPVAISPKRLAMVAQPTFIMFSARGRGDRCCGHERGGLARQFDGQVLRSF